MGFISGTVDAWEEFSFIQYNLYKNPGFLFCLPPGSNVKQQVAVALSYMRRHPKDWHRAASDMVFAAMRESFPCPAGYKPPGSN
jgi:hypothetical protein